VARAAKQFRPVLPALLRPFVARSRWLRPTPLAVAAFALCAQHAALAQDEAEPLPGTTLKLSPRIAAPGTRDGGKPLPIILLADQIRGRPDLDTVAEGNVELRRAGTVVRADRLSYDAGDDLAKALGHVRISREGNVFSGPELQLHVQRFEGFFVQPDYYFARTQAGGHAERVNFIDANRSEAINAIYTSCPRDGSGDPAWLLSTDRVRLDFDTNTGVAEGAVIRFYGVPILAAPVLSFPLSDDRKSGWLPPSMNLDSKSGFEFGVPYYWNIAPNRDATFTPTVMTRRGVSLETEFRYLQPGYKGRIDWNVLPNDRLVGRSRDAVQFQHEGDTVGAVHYDADLLRVSDDAYWKDFPHYVPSLTQRLLPMNLHVERTLPIAGDWSVYARVERWQVLNDADPATAAIAPPYDRSPQLGLHGAGRLWSGAAGGPEYSLETEFNRFQLAEGSGSTSVRPTEGSRAHLLGAVSWPFSFPGGWITPRMSVNAAAYRYRFTDATGVDVDGRASRVIPTFSLDAGLVFERTTSWFGRALRQTLEPRLQYLDTPYRAQSDLPNFDAAGKDFNEISVYSDNAFAGIDRVSDTHHIAAGVTSRWLDTNTGAELMRLGVVQRYLLRPQQITPSTEGGVEVQGAPSTTRFSDLMLLGSSTIWTHWTLGAAVQYDPDIKRPVRSLVGVRYSPGPFRTVNVNYRFTRGSSEQVELGWQWPIYRSARSGSGGRSCAGSWYGVGRLNYSMRDSKLTDSLAGIEYDAGCWIGRIVAERVSTGTSEATTRVMLQLELVGLSRLGSNPLRTLKDNIPGYRLLREERAAPGTSAIYD
jgi:LPS-assembly protein